MQPRCLGLVGGLAVGSTIYYYRELVRRADTAGVPLRLVMAHADVRFVLDRVAAADVDGLATYLSGFVTQLQGAGCEVAAIGAVTPHICIEQLVDLSPLPLVDILGVTNEAVRAQGFRRVAVFGTRFSIETALFGRITAAEVVRPTPSEVDRIHTIYTELAAAGRGTEAQRTELSDLARRLIDRERLDGVLLAGTDLSLVFDEQTTDFPHVDCARVHVEALMLRALGPI